MKKSVQNKDDSTNHIQMNNYFHLAYGFFNELFFSNSLGKPFFEIDLSKKFVLRFDNSINIQMISEKSKDDLIDNHIFIGIGILNVESKFDFMNHILHEMIHIHNRDNNIVDLNENQYHNMNFANKALNLGMGVQRDKNQGWCHTSITSNKSPKKDFKIHRENNRNLTEIVNRIEFDEKKHKEFIVSLAQMIGKSRPSKLFFLKYECSCPPPHNSIRSGRRPDGNNPIDITCDTCKSKFTCVSLSCDRY